MATLEELVKRIQYLEDLEAIKALKFKYARAYDEHSAELLREVFTKDGIWNGGEKYGVHKVDDDYLKWFAANTSAGPRLHFMTNPEITIEGDKAYARWLLIRASTQVSWVLGPTYEANDRARWLVCIEDDKYVKIDGIWKQTEMKVTIKFEIQMPFEWV